MGAGHAAAYVCSVLEYMKGGDEDGHGRVCIIAAIFGEVAMKWSMALLDTGTLRFAELCAGPNVHSTNFNVQVLLTPFFFWRATRWPAKKTRHLASRPI